MSWVLIVGAVWLVVAVALALGIGRAIRMADDEAAASAKRPPAPRKRPTRPAGRRRAGRPSARWTRPDRYSPPGVSEPPNPPPPPVPSS